MEFVVLGSKTPKQKRQTRYDLQDSDKCGCFSIKTGQDKRKKDSLKERIKQYSIWRFEEDESKDREYSRRRLARKQERRAARSVKMIAVLRKAHFLTAAVWILGLIITFGSTVRSLGEKTIFWQERHKYNIIGPCLLGFGVLLLMFVEAAIDTFRRRLLADARRRREVTLTISAPGMPADDSKMCRCLYCKNQRNVNAKVINEKTPNGTVQSESPIANGHVISAPESADRNSRRHSAKTARLAWKNARAKQISEESTDSVFSNSDESSSRLDSNSPLNVLNKVPYTGAYDKPLLKRQQSSMSRTSEISQFSTDCSESRPLVRR